MPSKYSIKDLELMSGIKAHTLRIWELRYNILKPQRTNTNIRYYNSSDLRRILNISILNKNGYKISNIANLSDEILVNQVEKFLTSYLQQDNKIEILYLALLELNEERFEDVIKNSILNFGFENTIEKILFPFLKHLGNMWQIGAISPAQEHYVSNMARQKLIVGLDKLAPDDNNNAKCFLFFLPENELHELGLLYAYYLAKSRGHKCIYFGQNVPLEDLATISELVNPDYIVSIFTCSMSDLELSNFLKSCKECLKESLFLISGRLLMNREEKPAVPDERFKLFEDFSDFRKWL